MRSSFLLHDLCLQPLNCIICVRMLEDLLAKNIEKEWLFEEFYEKANLIVTG